MKKQLRLLIHGVLATTLTQALVLSSETHPLDITRWKTFQNKACHFGFQYPPDYEVVMHGYCEREGLTPQVATIEGNGKIAYIDFEDWTEGIQRHTAPWGGWEFEKIAAYGATAPCLCIDGMADGPCVRGAEGETYFYAHIWCDVTRQSPVLNLYHVPGLEIEVNEIRQGFSKKTDAQKPRQPMYALDLSQNGSYRLLSFHTDDDKKAIPQEILQAIVRTVQVIP